jgi:hypothetical protein
MASTYSTDLRLELIGSGEQSGVWGSTTNLNLGQLIEQAVAGVETISIPSANYALITFYGAVDESRSAALILSSGTVANVYVPPTSKVYIVRNAGGNTITMYNSTVVGNTTAAGTGVTVAPGTSALMFTDGSNFYAGSFPNTSTTGTGNVVLSASPALTGIPTAPTANAGTSTTQIATTAFVQNVAGALGTLSSQNANAVAITGGTLANVALTTSTVNSNIVGSNSVGARTISSSGPTGGANGDIWYRV